MTRPLIQRLLLQNFLSFGPTSEPVELGPLNVLIGPNGSGKSNFIEAFSLLQALPRDLAVPIREGGGASEWSWKRGGGDRFVICAELKDCVQLGKINTFSHYLDFDSLNNQAALTLEKITRYSLHDIVTEQYFVSDINVEDVYHGTRSHSLLMLDDDQDFKNISMTQSILAQRNDPENYQFLWSIAEFYKSIAIYRSWTMGKNSPGRGFQRTDLPVERMLPDGSNMVLFINKLRKKPLIKKRLIEIMGEFYEGLDDIDVEIGSSAASLYFTEGEHTIPAARMSDGTLRYLFLVSILLDPEPPPVICIEEPELGLHPDSIVMLAQLLIEASERTQLIITTHSDVLVDALSKKPDSVLVCERYEEGTFIERIKSEQVEEYLKKYSLGQLWRSGHIGGNRW